MLPQGRRYKTILKRLHSISNKIVELKKTQYRYSNFDKSAVAITDESGNAIRTSFLDLAMDATENKNIFTNQDLKYLVNTFLFAVS